MLNILFSSPLMHGMRNCVKLWFILAVRVQGFRLLMKTSRLPLSIQFTHFREERPNASRPSEE